jgi:hypothetical protein
MFSPTSRDEETPAHADRSFRSLDGGSENTREPRRTPPCKNSYGRTMSCGGGHASSRTISKSGRRHVECLHKKESITTEYIPNGPNQQLQSHTNLRFSRNDCVSTLIRTIVVHFSILDEHCRPLRDNNKRGRCPNNLPTQQMRQLKTRGLRQLPGPRRSACRRDQAPTDGSLTDQCVASRPFAQTMPSHKTTPNALLMARHMSQHNANNRCEQWGFVLQQ